MKKILSLIFCLCLVTFSVFSVDAQGSAVSWYCIRKKDHSQPQLPSELSFVKNYEVYWCDEKNTSFDSDEKVIYLTFDAGYENGNIEKIVNILKEENVKASFFILDNMILKNEALVKRMIDDGHIVANHTLKHKDLTKLESIEDVSKELGDLERLFESTYRVKMPKLYRPPEGKLSERSVKWAQELGYKAVMWSFAYADWDNGKQPCRQYAMNKILENIHNGEVMLLHPTSSTNAEIMKDLIRELKAKGFRFATVEELCKEEA